MADQQYSQYPAGQAGYSYGSYTGDSSNSQSGYGSANTEAYTLGDLRELAKVAVKAHHAVRAEFHDCQTRFKEATRAKNEVESRCLQLSREKNAIQTRLEESEEEMAEVKKKYKAALAQLSEVGHKLEHLAGQSEDKNGSINRYVRNLESRLKRELTWLSSLELGDLFELAKVTVKAHHAVSTEFHDCQPWFKEDTHAKNELGDLRELAKVAVKAHHAVRAEFHGCQTRFKEATHAKNEAESRCLQRSREKSAIQTLLEESEEEMAEVTKKYKAILAQLSEVGHKLEHLAGKSEDKNDSINRLVRDLKSELEREQTWLSHLELSEVGHKLEHLAGQSEDKNGSINRYVGDFESRLERELTWLSCLEGSSSASCGESSAPAGNGGYGSYGANEYRSNQSQYSYGQQPSASSYSTGNIHRITFLKSRSFSATSIRHRFIRVGAWRLRRTRRYDRGSRGGGGYGINEKVDELPHEPPAETLHASCSSALINSTSQGEK